MKAVEINNIKFLYPSKSNYERFEINISGLSINEGEFISLIGANGCGKSTLLKLISSIINPISGSIKIYEKSIYTLPPKNLAKLISYVPQSNFSVFPYSVYEVVMMGRYHNMNLMGFESEMDKEIVINALKEMQIEKLLDKGIKELSGGEAQRVFIARALAQQSKIILLDEPTSHLDLEHQILIFEKLQKLNKENGITVITVSHDLNLVAKFSKRTVIMKDGSISLDGYTQNVLTSENIRLFFNVSSEIVNRTDNKFSIIINP